MSVQSTPDQTAQAPQAPQAMDAAQAQAPQAAEEQTLHDFVLNLLSDDAARSAFAQDPAAALSGAGLGDITAQDVQDVIPLVIDYTPIGDGGQAFELALSNGDPIVQLQAVADAAEGAAAVAAGVTTDEFTATAKGVLTEDGLYGEVNVDTEHGGASGWLDATAEGVSVDTAFDTEHLRGEAGAAVGTDGDFSGYARLDSEAATVDAGVEGSVLDRVEGSLALDSEHFTAGNAFAASAEGVQVSAHGESDLAAYELGADASTDGVYSGAFLATDHGNAGYDLALDRDGLAASTGVQTDQVHLDARTEVTESSLGLETESASAAAELGLEDGVNAGAALGVEQLIGVDAGLVLDEDGFAAGATVATPVGELGLEGFGIPALTAPELPGLDGLPLDGLGALPLDPGTVLDGEALRGADLSAGTVADFVTTGGALIGDTVDTAAAAAPAGLGDFLTGATAPVTAAVDTGAGTIADTIDGLPAVPALPVLPALPEVPDLGALPTELPTDLPQLPTDLPVDLPVALPELPELPVANPLTELEKLPETVSGALSDSPLGDVVHGTTDLLGGLGNLDDHLHLGH
ncbi:IniB N-terminal domain-containing protein [Actinokineospora pegani]|uniref:IniB N-terminal domain-containing protein n=1 Tax=Actinokineospora pegani TaxID=2654637 RepID=UPI0012EA53F2|nr:IniB N-terminal domain-containing protein [Actinokineospora pegani]